MTALHTDTGMNALTGRALRGLAHLRQSIAIILTTRLGSRVMRRDFGSRLFDLIDSNMSGAGLSEIYASIADALQKWEPRFRLSRVQIASDRDDLAKGYLKLNLSGTYVPLGQQVLIEGLVL